MIKLLERMKDWLRRLSKPVDLPPDSDPPPPIERKWEVREIWRERTPRKVMCVRSLGEAIVVSSYDGKSREASWLHFKKPDGSWYQIYKGGDETLGPIGEWNGRFYFCAENGKHILSVGPGGDLLKHARIPDNAQYNIIGTIWRNRPVFAAVGKRKGLARVFDAISGGQLTTLGLDGLVAGLCVTPNNDLIAAHSWGSTGLSSASGRVNRSVKPACVAWSEGYGLVVGGMDDGLIWFMGEEWWANGPQGKIDLNCSKVNRLVAAHGRVWFAGANPDTFGFIVGNNEYVTIARFQDEKKDKTGEQFDADIWPVSSSKCYIARKFPGGCVVYECNAR
ncbi:MAG: hypothetical protein QXS54_03680 [Candidatus Methanomethylicaceae archaeon]